MGLVVSQSCQRSPPWLPCASAGPNPMHTGSHKLVPRLLLDAVQRPCRGAAPACSCPLAVAARERGLAVAGGPAVAQRAVDVRETRTIVHDSMSRANDQYLCAASAPHDAGGRTHVLLRGPAL